MNFTGLGANKAVDELIGEIRGLARHRVDSVILESTIDEVFAHLDSSIQARLELGDDVEIATLHAIEAFGKPSAFVDDMFGPEYVANDSRVDLGVASALALSVLLVSVVFTIESSDSMIFGAIGFGAAVTAWRSWKATRFQFPSLCGAFVFAVLIFSIIGSFNYAPIHMDWGMGLNAGSVSVGILALSSLVSWIFGCLFRGTIGKEISRARQTGFASTPTQGMVAQLVVFLTAGTIALVAETLNNHYAAFQMWAGIALLVAAANAAITGWRCGVFRGKQMIGAMAASLVASTVLLSAYFVRLSDGEFGTRTDITRWAYESKPDMRLTEKARLDKFISETKRNLSAQTPPYKLPVSIYAPNATARKTAASYAEAMQMLEGIRVRQSRLDEKNAELWDAYSSEYYRRQNEERLILKSPILNAARMLPFAFLKSMVVWVVAFSSHAFAVAAQLLLKRGIHRDQGIA